MNFYEEYAQINGIKQYFLHYPAPSSDTVLLFLHGGPGFTAAYRAYLLTAEELPCSLVFYDQRGTGKTLIRNKTDKPVFSELLEDLHATVAYLKKKYKTDKLLLLGHSWGSVLGSEYVLRHSNTVSAYIGMGQVVNMLRGEAAAFAELERRVWIKSRKRDIRKCEKLKQRLSFESREAFRKSRRGLGMLRLRYGFCPNPFTGIKTVLKSPVFHIKDIPFLILSFLKSSKLDQFLWEYDAAKNPAFPLPVYYILGENDWQVPSTVATAFFDKISVSRKRLFWIPDAGHSTDTDHPAAFWKVVKDIIKLEYV